MRITECRVKILDQEPVCAIASITLDGQFVVKGIRVLNIQARYMVCMPSRRGPDGSHRDVAHPVNARARQVIEDAVLDAYQDELDRLESGDPADDFESAASYNAGDELDEGRPLCTPGG